MKQAERGGVSALPQSHLVPRQGPLPAAVVGPVLLGTQVGDPQLDPGGLWLCSQSQAQSQGLVHPR